MQKNVTKRIALVLPGASTSNWRRFEGVMEYTQSHSSWDVMTITTELLDSVKEQIRQHNPAGIICGLVEKDIRDILLALNVPMVIAFQPQKDLLSLSRVAFVLCDHAALSKTAAHHMIERGYRHFAFALKNRTDWAEERRIFFEKALRRQNFASRTLDMGRPSKELASEIRRLPNHTAVLAADDITATELTKFCRRNGIHVPNDLGVVGISNFASLCESSIPALTSIDQNLRHGGYLAAERLNTMLNGGIVPKVTHYAPGPIHERDSLPPLAALHSHPVDRALAYIRQHLTDPIEVPDVVAAAEVSRRKLESLFANEMPESIAGTIRTRRLNLLAAELKKTDAPLSLVCQRCGWVNDAHVKHVFKRHFGMTMTEWRSR